MRRLIYKDTAVNIYDDIESCTLVLVNRDGVVKGVHYDDDDFIYISNLFDEYMDLVEDYLLINVAKEKLYKKMKFVKFLKKQGVDDETIENFRQDYLEMKKRQEERRKLCGR